MTSDATLAYVFWHWRLPEVEAEQYERSQNAFHAALAEDPPPGFVCSIRSALSGAPWANSGEEAYQDRYLIRDSGALDTLDDWVTHERSRATHDAVARVAAGGTGALYQARLGAPVDTPRHALWFPKPEGTRYPELFARCRSLIVDGASVLWARRMALGPGPEFCLESVAPLDLPTGISPLRIPLRTISKGS